jgi:para-nitrobenzyl esterase
MMTGHQYSIAGRPLMASGWRGVALLIFLASAPSLAQVPIKAIANQELLVGELRGGIANFRAIPFAQPPVGNMRWRAPRPPIPRQGEQMATEFARACMQTSYITEWYQDVLAAFDGDVANAAQPNAVSEDCLYLNIWSPDVTAEEKLPVMVFIHGGNNQGGWSYEPNYLGHTLAARGVVVVSITYRLGVFGFFAHPQLTAESGTGSSGNYGLLDQISAFKWIGNNIAAFGGDPDNITAVGESAGGANLGQMMLSPLAKGLFKNAIRQSGSYDINYRDTLVGEEAFGAAFADTLVAPSVKALREIPADKILASAETFYHGGTQDPQRNYFYGAKDGYVLPDYVEELYQAGSINPANVLLGSNADEKLMYAPRNVSQENIDGLIAQYFKDDASDEVRALLAHLPSARLQYAELMDAKQQACTAQLQADAISGHERGAVYLYHFTRVRPGVGGERLGAYHGAELPYVFNTHDDWLSGDEIDVGLTETVMGYWVNFAKTGNPNGSGLPKWPRYYANARQALELGDAVRVIDAPRRALCDLLKPPQP